MRYIIIGLIMATNTAYCQTINVINPLDNSEQPATFECNGSEVGAIFLHSWLYNYTQGVSDGHLDHARDRNWSFVSPNFRGPQLIDKRINFKLALADILAAVIKLRLDCKVQKVYAIGGSGGGFMGLAVLKKYPGIFDKATFNVPITDLNKWRRDLIHDGSPVYRDRFVPQIEKLCSVRGKFSKRLCKRRSPISGIKFVGIPLMLIHGKQDTVVNPSHSVDYYRKVVGVYLQILKGGHVHFPTENYQFLESDLYSN